MVTPVANHRRISDSVLNEHALRLGHRQEELVKCFFVVLAQGPQPAFRTILELDLAGKLLEFVFERHGFWDCVWADSYTGGRLDQLRNPIPKKFQIPNSKSQKNPNPKQNK